MQHSGHGLKIIHNTRKERELPLGLPSDLTGAPPVPCVSAAESHTYVTCNDRKANKTPCKDQHPPSQ